VQEELANRRIQPLCRLVRVATLRLVFARPLSFSELPRAIGLGLSHYKKYEGTVMLTTALLPS
jgi:hypothetical protein